MSYDVYYCCLSNLVRDEAEADVLTERLEGTDAALLLVDKETEVDEEDGHDHAHSATSHVRGDLLAQRCELHRLKQKALVQINWVTLYMYMFMY